MSIGVNNMRSNMARLTTGLQITSIEGREAKVQSLEVHCGLLRSFNMVEGIGPTEKSILLRILRDGQG